MEAAGAESAAAAATQLPEVNPLAVSGDIIAAGSSTVYPLTERMAERFIDEGYAGNITIDSIGTGAGFERFCKAGETDIANASRADQGREIESCAAIGRTPVEFRVGTDALAVVVNPANDWVGPRRRDDGRTGEALLRRRHQLVGCEPGLAGGADQALQPRARTAAPSTTSSKR